MNEDTKTTIYNKLFQQFSELNIKRFYATDGKNNDEYACVLRKDNKNRILVLMTYFVKSKINKVNQDISNMRKRVHFVSNIKKEREFRNFCKIYVESKFSINFDSKFMDSSFLHRVHEHFIRKQCFTNDFNKYKIQQVMFLVNTSLIMDTADGKEIFK